MNDRALTASLTDRDEARKETVIEIPITFTTASYLQDYLILSPGCELVPESGTTFTWDWGDGTVETGLSSNPLPHKYTYSGDGRVTIRITGRFLSIGTHESHGQIVVPYNANILLQSDASCRFMLSGDNITSLGEATTGDEIDYTARAPLYGLKLSSVELPRTLQVFGDMMLAGNYVASMNIPKSLKRIGKYALQNSRLQTLVFPTGLETIETYAVFGNSYLTSVSLPSTLSFIGKGNFTNCANVTSFTVSTWNPRYSDRHMNMLVDENTKELMVCPGKMYPASIPSDIVSLGPGCMANKPFSTYSVPSTVTSVGDSCFSNCTNLTSISFDGTIECFPNSCFSGCTSLSSFPGVHGLRTIGPRAFERCKLSSIVVPEGVTSVGSNAFDSQVSTLSTVVVPSTVDSVGSYSLVNGTTPVSGTKVILKSPNFIEFNYQITKQVSTIEVDPSLVSQYTGSPWRTYGGISSVVAHYEPVIMKVKITSPKKLLVIEGVETVSGTTFSVDWGDGSAAQVSQSIPESYVSHSYSTPGTYTVTVTGKFVSFGRSGWARACVFAVESQNDIPYNYLYDAESVQEIDFGYGMTTIYGRFFYNMHVSRIVIPSTVVSIPETYALYGYIDELTILSRTPPSMSNLYNYSLGSLLVPPQSVSAYKSANGWSKFSSKTRAVG